MPEIPPWLRSSPSDFTQAAGAGSSAGTAVGHLRQSAIDAQNRVAAEAAALQQRASEAQAELAQRNVLARMEMQARQDIAEKMRLHEQQQLEVQKAYHEGQIGLGMQKLQEANAIARAKAEAAAGQFADEAALAQHIAGGGKMAEGLMKYSRARPQFIHALQQTVPAAEYMPREATIGGQKLIVNPHTGHYTLNNGDLINMHLPINPSDPLGGGKMDRKVSLPEAYQLAGTNAPNLFPNGPGVASPANIPAAAVPQFRYNPKSKKIEPISATTQPVIDIPASVDEESE
jgi:hypothetical protein